MDFLDCLLKVLAHIFDQVAKLVGKMAQLTEVRRNERLEEAAAKESGTMLEEGKAGSSKLALPDPFDVCWQAAIEKMQSNQVLDCRQVAIEKVQSDQVPDYRQAFAYAEEAMDCARRLGREPGTPQLDKFVDLSIKQLANLYAKQRPELGEELAGLIYNFCKKNMEHCLANKLELVVDHLIRSLFAVDYYKLLIPFSPDSQEKIDDATSYPFDFSVSYLGEFHPATIRAVWARAKVLLPAAGRNLHPQKVVFARIFEHLKDALRRTNLSEQPSLEKIWSRQLDRLYDRYSNMWSYPGHYNHFEVRTVRPFLVRVIDAIAEKLLQAPMADVSSIIWNILKIAGGLCRGQAITILACEKILNDQAPDEKPGKRAETLLRVSEFAERAGLYDLLERVLLARLEIQKEMQIFDDEDILSYRYRNLGKAKLEKGCNEDASFWFQRALEIREKYYAPKAADLAELCYWLLSVEFKLRPDAESTWHTAVKLVTCLGEGNTFSDEQVGLILKIAKRCWRKEEGKEDNIYWAAYELYKYLLSVSFVEDPELTRRMVECRKDLSEVMLKAKPTAQVQQLLAVSAGS